MLRSSFAGRKVNTIGCLSWRQIWLGRQVAVIVAPGGAPAALAAKSATTTIPIVFEMGADPIAIGLVGSLSRPEGNLTGVTSLNVEVGPKRLEILREVIPTAAVVAVLVNPTSPTADSQLRNLQAAAHRPRACSSHVLHASTERDFDAVFATLLELRAAGLVVASDTFFATHSEAACRPSYPPRGARDPPVSRLHDRRRPDELRRQFCGVAPSGWRLYRTHTQGREAC